jgi:D-alanine-D-alanine ligase
VVVLFGGRSVEREVSRLSARTIVGALDPARYEVIPIAVGRDGSFLPAAESARLLASGPVPEKYRVGAAESPPSSAGTIVPVEISPGRADVVFPIVHGTTGEDGVLQGFLETLGVPYVGAGVTGSAIGMDKAVTKALLRDAGIPTVKFAAATSRDDAERLARRLPKEGFALPLFVKPSCGGSSVGVTKVKSWDALAVAVARALAFDEKALVEEGIDARELECAVLGNDDPKASGVGEIVPGREFYDYEDKYVENGAKLLVPAPIPEATAATVRDLAVRTFRACGISGMARVDFFLERGTDRVLVNELNTLPGFTAISMYPRLWEASGLPLPKLLDELIRLAFERAERRRRLSHEPPKELA